MRKKVKVKMKWLWWISSRGWVKSCLLGCVWNENDM